MRLTEMSVEHAAIFFCQNLHFGEKISNFD